MWLMAQRWAMRRTHEDVFDDSTVHSVPLKCTFFSLFRVRKYSSLAQLQWQWPSTVLYTGLLWQERAHISHHQTSVSLRGVKELDPGTDWPFSADAYAGLLNLHEQQTSTNTLLTMSNGRHMGARQTLKVYTSERQSTKNCTGNMLTEGEPNHWCMSRQTSADRSPLLHWIMWPGLRSKTDF